MKPRAKTAKPRGGAAPLPAAAAAPAAPPAPDVLHQSRALTVTATVISVAPLGGGGTEPTLIEIKDVRRVELKTISDATAPFVKTLLYIMLGVGLLGVGVTGLCAFDPTINGGMLARYHLDLGALLPFPAGFALLMYGALVLNDRMKVLLLTLASGETRELMWATSKASLDEAEAAKAAIAEAHTRLSDSDAGAD